jgi:hypothetical protein
MPEIIALGVGAIGGEFGAVAQERAPMEPSEESLHYGLGEQREIIDGRQCAGVYV